MDLNKSQMPKLEARFFGDQADLVSQITLYKLRKYSPPALRKKKHSRFSRNRGDLFK